MSKQIGIARRGRLKMRANSKAARIKSTKTKKAHRNSPNRRKDQNEVGLVANIQDLLGNGLESWMGAMEKEILYS